jgi:hypothetical protein
MLALCVLAGCGGSSTPPRLADGSPPPDLPEELAHLGDGVMTEVSAMPATVIDPSDRAACGLFPASGVTDGSVIRRVGVSGISVTFAVDSSIRACDVIASPAPDPDRPAGSPWCGGSYGRTVDGRLADPRLDLCTAKGGDLTAFAWVQPGARTRWVVVSDRGRREVYPVAGGLPVRVTTIDGVDRESSSASFDVEEYGPRGSRLREYTLKASVAG